MKYRVIHFFTDLQDNDYPYNAGDIFPRDGLTVSKERLKELSGSNNKQGKSLIELTEEETTEPSDSDITFEERTEQKQYTKTEIQRMSTAELQALAAEVGIEDAFETSGNELKKKLITHFNI